MKVLQPPSILFQFKIIIIKSANQDLFTTPMHWVITFFIHTIKEVDNQIFKNHYALQ